MQVKAELGQNTSQIEGLIFLPLTVEARFELGDWKDVSEPLRDRIIDQLNKGNKHLLKSFILCFPQPLWGKLVVFLTEKRISVVLDEGRWGMLSISENRDVVGQCSFFIAFEEGRNENLKHEIEQNLLENADYLRQHVAWRINEGKLIRILAQG